MSCRARVVWGIVGVLVLGAGSLPEAQDQLLRGDAAFQRGDYADALSWYQRAEERATEPGLIAFNKAVALYRLERYAEAEVCYRQCLEDAEGHRRGAALFGLANCLVRQSGEFGARPLRQAIGHYRECLRMGGQDLTLREDARSNLELAKLLLLDAKEAPDRPEPPRDLDANNTRPQPNPLDRDSNTRPDGAGEQSPGSLGRGQQQLQAGREGTVGDQQAKGGVGNLPPVPDQAELVPLPPEVAAALLQQAGERVSKARQAETPAPKDPVGVMDR